MSTARIETTPAPTTTTTAASASARRRAEQPRGDRCGSDPGDGRRRAREDQPEPARDPTRERPAAGRGRARSRSARARAPRPRARRGRGWPRNDGSRCPGRQASNTFRAPRNCRTAPIVAAALHATSVDEQRASAPRASRIASGTASASSAYSANFAAVSGVRDERVAVGEDGPERRAEQHDREERGGRDPDGPRGAERREPEREAGREPDGPDREHGDVREVERRVAPADRHRGATAGTSTCRNRSGTQSANEDADRGARKANASEHIREVP